MKIKHEKIKIDKKRGGFYKNFKDIPDNKRVLWQVTKDVFPRMSVYRYFSNKRDAFRYANDSEKSTMVSSDIWRYLKDRKNNRWYVYSREFIPLTFFGGDY